MSTRGPFFEVRFRWFLWGLALAVVSVEVSTADDRVTLIPEGSNDPVVIVGTVEDFSGAELIIQRAGAPSPDHFPSARIISVQTWHTAAHDQGLAELAQGKTPLAEQTLLKALRDDPRDWVQREIQAALLQCALRRGDWGTAGTRFLKITNQDPRTRHWNVAPLIWAPQSLGDGDKTLARGWLQLPEPPARLLAASWLLLDPAYGEVAEKKLNEAARDSNSIVATLARSQLWRLRMGPDLNEIEIAKWRQEIRRMPQLLRAGPQYLLGRGLLQRQEHAAAAGELMWLPTVYRDNEELTARAMSDAGQALSKLAKTREALTVYDELIARYPWSPWASEAREARSVLSHSPDSSDNPRP